VSSGSGGGRRHAAGVAVALVLVAGVGPALGSVAAGDAPATVDGDAVTQTRTLTAAFDPARGAPGDEVQLYIESSRANATVRITSPQLTTEQIAEVVRAEDGVVELGPDGELTKVIGLDPDHLDEPGEYEFVFRDVDTGVETTAVLEVTSSSSQDLSAEFEPRRISEGESVQLVVESTRANAEIGVSSQQLSDELLQEYITPERPGTTVTLDGGQWTDDLPTGGLETGEYEFVFRDVDTGVETTAVLTVTEGSTATPVPESREGLAAQFDPRRVQIGDGSILAVAGGTPGAELRVSSPQLSREQLQEIFPSGIALDGEGRYENDIGVPGFLEAGEYEFIFTDPETGVETTAVLVVTADDGQSAGTGPPDVEGNGTPLPERGFFVNGEGDPLGPLSNFLNLTVLGFLLSVVGIFYQLMEGR
jgi:hypothetical protein